MSAEQRSRALMTRHHHMIKNRQQSMLRRTTASMGMPMEEEEHWNTIQGKPYADSSRSYDRSHSAMS